jgi:hypothetical protein
MRERTTLKAVSDDELLRRLSHLVSRSRRLDAEVVAHIAEVDARKLYAREAMPSMFAYCVQVLGLGESETYLRIAAARASREYPPLLEMLRDGRVLLSAAARLASHLTPDNSETVLKRAAHRSKREIEELIAELDPRPETRPAIRRLPTSSQAAHSLSSGPPAVTSSAPVALTSAPIHPTQLVPERVELETSRSGASAQSRPGAGASPFAPAHRAGRLDSAHRARVETLAPSRHRVQFTASDALRGKLERLQALMRTTVRDGDLAAIIEVAVTEKLERLEAKRFAMTRTPRKTLEEVDPTPSSRHIPAPVRRAVYARDGGRCTFRDARGRRCPARERLEFHHHDRPFGRGGDHGVKNIRLVCRTHNELLAERDYGREKMTRHRKKSEKRRLPCVEGVGPMTGRHQGVASGTPRADPPP